MATATPLPESQLLQSPVIENDDSVSDAQSSSGLASDTLAVGVMFALVLTVGQRVIGFVRGILFCRLMTDQELGQWSMVWSFLMLMAPLAMLGLPGCFGKYSEYFRRRGQLRSFVYRVGSVSLTLSVLVSAIVVLFPAAFAELFFRDPNQIELVRCMGITLLAVAVSNFAVSLMESLRQVRLVTLMRFITGMGFALIGSAMLIVWKNNASAVTLAYGVCCLLGAIPACWMGWKISRSEWQTEKPLNNWAMWKRIAPFAGWLWVSNLLHNLFEVSDRYMLIHWSDTTSDVAQSMVGQYHSGRVIPLLMVSVATMLAGVLLPYLSAAWEAGRKEAAARQLNWTYKLVGLSFTAGGLLVLLLSPLFFDWLLQGRYNDGRAVLPMTLVYCIWFSMYTVGQDYLWVANKGRLATIAVGLGLLANVGLNMVLIPVWGLSGAVVATTAGNLFVVILILACNHWHGCPTDRGIWLISLVPPILLAPIWAAIIVLLATGLFAWRSNLMFSRIEKEQIHEVVSATWNKLTERLLPTDR